MSEINLSEIRASTGNAAVPTTTEISRFKNESSTVPRVVATSNHYIIYSLKKRAFLRVIVIISGNQLAYKNHTSDVTVAKFVNTRSNVVCSCSANETFVWLIGDSETHTYFKVDMQVAAVAWVLMHQKPPDLLIVHQAKGEANNTFRASLLKASSLIQQSTSGDNQQPDGKLVANEATDLSTVVPQIVTDTPFVDAASPILAVSASPNSIITCTLTNLKTPAWKPCNGEKLVDVVLMPGTDTLVAGWGAGLSLWTVAGEPCPLQTIRFFQTPDRTITSVKATVGRLIATSISSNTVAPEPEAAVFKFSSMSNTAQAVSFFGLQAKVTHTNASAMPYKDEELQLCADKGDTLQFLIFNNAPWNSLPGFQQPTAGMLPPDPAIAMGALSNGPPPNFMPMSVPAPTIGLGALSNAAIQQTVAPPPPYAGSLAVPQQPQPMWQPPAQVTSPFQRPGVPPHQIRNPTLPQPPSVVLRGASHLTQPGSQVEHHRTTISNALQNASSMLGLVKTMIPQDHEKLVEEALNAAFLQHQEVLIQAMDFEGGGGDTGAAVDQAVQAIVPNVAAAVVEGVAAAVEQQIKDQLTAALRVALTKQVKKSKETRINDLKERVDATLKEAITNIGERIQQKHGDYTSRLVFNVSSVSEEGTQAVTQLQQTIAKQDELLRLISTSGLIEEVRSLRQQVADLKAKAAAGGVQETPQLSFETILGNAQRMIDEGNHVQGLQWVFRSKDDELLYEVLARVDAERKDAMIDDLAITNDMWTRIIAALASTPKAQTLPTSLSWMSDILIEKQELMSNSSLIKNIQDFIDTWKSQSAKLSEEAKQSLRVLQMTLRK